MAGFIAIIGAVFSAICSAVAGVIRWWAATVPWYVTLGLAAGIALFGWGYHAGGGSTGGMGCSCRELMCGKRQPRPPRPERTHQEAGTIGAWISPVQFTLVQPAKIGKRTIERPCTLRYVASDASPAAMTLSEQLAPVGSQVSVEALGGRILGAAPETTGETTDAPGRDATPEEVKMWEQSVEARGPIVGVVTNANGQDCGLALVSAGLATVGPEAPVQYQAAMHAAAKRKHK